MKLSNESTNKGLKNTKDVEKRIHVKSTARHDRPAVFMEYTNQTYQYINLGNNYENY